jgi:hypothetical protein
MVLKAYVHINVVKVGWKIDNSCQEFKGSGKIWTRIIFCILCKLS